MKKYMMIAFAAAMMLVAGTAESSAQTANPIYSAEQVDQRAMFPGGQEGMMSFMMQNMKYPKEAEKDKAQGCEAEGIAHQELTQRETAC